eukprot:gene43319-58665_t
MRHGRQKAGPDQFDQFGHLLGFQRQRGDAQSCALGDVFTVGFQHVSLQLRSKVGLHARLQGPREPLR